MRRRFETRDASTDGKEQEIESRSDIRFEILYGRDGRRVITSRDGKVETMGDRLAMSELSLAGQSAGHEIRDGRVITMLLGCRSTSRFTAVSKASSLRFSRQRRCTT